MARSDFLTAPQSSIKRKKLLETYQEQQHSQQDEEDDGREKKRIRNCTTWENLDVILLLQSKEAHLQSKVKVSFDFISSEESDGDEQLQPVSFSRALLFVFDWMQSLLMYSDRNKKADEFLDPCLDYRCWAVIRLCSQKLSAGASPNFFRALTPVLKQALLALNPNLLLEAECNRLLENVLQCLSSLLTSNSRAFYNVGVDLWISVATDVLNIISRVSTTEMKEVLMAKVLLDLSSLLLEHFASFLRFHPNPKNIFRVFVERLVEQIFELLVLLQLRTKDSCSEQLPSLRKAVEDVMLNGLLHPAHISGFLSSRASIVDQNEKARGTNESYHRHLFKKLDEIIQTKKVTALGGFAYLLRLLATKSKALYKSSLPFSGHQALKNSTEVYGDAQEASIPLFEAFMQFIKPLLHECKHYAEERLPGMPGALDNNIMELHCMLRSLNETLSIFVEEKIYIRTEDTLKEKHYCFLKEIYDAFYFTSIKIHTIWLSEFQMSNETKKLLPLLAREIVSGVDFILEIEYKVLGDDLVTIWLMLLSFLTSNISITDHKPCSLLMNEIVILGCKLINVYSELRQVNTPLFSLCKALRYFLNTNDCIADEYKVFYSSFSSSSLCLKAAKALLCSHDLRLTIASTAKIVPEGQAGNCIQLLNLDIADALEWIKQNSYSADKKILIEVDKAELLGSTLSEIYEIVLKSLRITTTNSISIGNSLKNLIKTLRPSLGCFVRIQSDNVNDFTLSITGRKLSDFELTEDGDRSLVRFQCASWFFLYCFRLYATCRSLYRQTIGFLPPDLSHKASESMGDLLMVSFSMDWVEIPREIDRGYFFWIDNPSISLLEAVKLISVDTLSSSFEAYSPLVYVLLVITIQRLNDLARLIKASEFFLNKKESAAQIQLQDGTVVQNSIKKWEQLVADTRKEAVELTKFMMGYLSLFDLRGPVGTFDGDCKTNFVYDHEWDRGVCSLNKESLHVAVWWLFCQCTDVWCLYSSKKNLKRFFSYLLSYSLPCPHNYRDIADVKRNNITSNNVTLHRISMESLQDVEFCEQMMIYTSVSSRFCHFLKKMLSSLVNKCAITLDLNSLPNWVDQLKILDKEPVIISEDLEHVKEQLSTSSTLMLKIIGNMLNLSCNIFYDNTKSLSRFAKYILNIERVLLSYLLNNNNESVVYDPLELLRLFVSCRRVMKCLVMRSEDKDTFRNLRSICTVFDCTSSILWLFKSVYKVVGLPDGFFWERDSSMVQDMIYSLLDHTYYLFIKISEAKTNATLLILLNGTVNKDQLSITSSWQPSTEWEHVELIADALKQHAEKLTETFESCNQPIKLDVCNYSIEWSKFSAVISCFQALLLGLTSASDRMLKEKILETHKISDIVLYCVSKISNHIAIFENFICTFMKMLILNVVKMTENYFCFKGDSTEDTGKNSAKIEVKRKPCESASSPAKEKENAGASTTKKHRSQATHIKWATAFFQAVTEIDLKRLKLSCGSWLQYLLLDINYQAAFILKHLFATSAIILKIKCMPSCNKHLNIQTLNLQSNLSSTVILFGIPCVILQEFSEMNGQPCWLSFAWLDGILTYFDVVGNLFSFVNPAIFKDVYAYLIDLHLKAMGKCISLQGITANLTYFDRQLDAKMLESQTKTSRTYWRSLGQGKFNFGLFKSKLRMSIKKLIMIQSEMYKKMTIEIIERKLVGVRKDYQAVYLLNNGKIDREVISDSAAIIECFEIILECFSGHKQIFKKSLPIFAGALINIVLHLQNPSIFYTGNNFSSNCKVNADAGAIILMCIEALTKVVGRISFKMNPCYVSQYFHMPMVLFSGFHKLKASHVAWNSSIYSCGEERNSFDANQLCTVDSQYVVDLYTSCCRLMCSTIKHRKSEAERCIALLEESLSTLLNCLEVVDSDTAKSLGYFCWDLGEAVKCSTFLRRIYEEIRHQKDVLGKYASVILSNYISTFSGCGPSKAGLKREIDEALRPGVYSLIDICSRDDLQQLHSLLNEGACKATLATLLHDYEHNFHYEGKI